MTHQTKSNRTNSSSLHVHTLQSVQCACSARVCVFLTIVPSLSALFPDSSRQRRRDDRPFLRSVLLHQSLDELVLLRLPRPLDEARVQHFLPAVQTLNVALRRTERGEGNFFPEQKVERHAAGNARTDVSKHAQAVRQTMGGSDAGPGSGRRVPVAVAVLTNSFLRAGPRSRAAADPARCSTYPFSSAR